MEMLRPLFSTGYTAIDAPIFCGLDWVAILPVLNILAYVLPGGVTPAAMGTVLSVSFAFRSLPARVATTAVSRCTWVPMRPRSALLSLFLGPVAADIIVLPAVLASSIRSSMSWSFIDIPSLFLGPLVVGSSFLLRASCTSSGDCSGRFSAPCLSSSTLPNPPGGVLDKGFLVVNSANDSSSSSSFLFSSTASRRRRSELLLTELRSAPSKSSPSFTCPLTFRIATSGVFWPVSCTFKFAGMAFLIFSISSRFLIWRTTPAFPTLRRRATCSPMVCGFIASLRTALVSSAVLMELSSDRYTAIEVPILSGFGCVAVLPVRSMVAYVSRSITTGTPASPR
ncbi:unnamed protein product [Leptidea sinapis]|uniref:Uncharacterized protein n=1 Tax=Leptidea sinapis TaxID=189913 RepID=A0A5E4PVR2_9NEOP|nr:unnamed protein product [Leptidea sinapis]